MGQIHAVAAEDLLPHLAWAKALAKHLVIDEATADDVVQESMVLALERPPRGRGPGGEGLRPWLGTVLRNVARQRGRSEGRRARRQREAARGEALPSALELTGRAEGQKLVLEALLTLDEDSRRLVLLRYEEGLSAAEIARRTDRLDATVRSRLKRSLDRLRDELDRRHGGDRGAWHNALAPLILGATAKRAAVASLFPGTSLLWGSLAALGAAALVGWVALLRPAPWDSGPGPAPSSPPDSLASLEPSEPRAPGSAPAEDAAPRAPLGSPPRDASSTATTAVMTDVRVRFVDSSARPIQGVSVELPRKEAVTSDQGGEVFLKLPLGGETRTHSLGVHRLGYATDEVRWEGQAGGSIDVGDVVLSPGGDIMGRVVDSEGQPCAGFSVSTEGKLRSGPSAGGLTTVEITPQGQTRAVTDGEGRFRLRGASAGVVDVEVSGKARLWSGRAGAVVVVPGKVTDELVIVAKGPDPDTLIQGVILDHRGQPAAHGYVRATWGSWFRRHQDIFQADAEGRFVGIVNKGGTARMRVTAAGFGPAQVSLLDVKGGTRDLVIRLPEPRTRRITVVDGRGVPVAGARIAVSMDGGGAGDRITAEDGTAQLPVSSEALELWVRADGCEDAELSCPGTSPERWTQEGPLVIEMRRIAQLVGTVAVDGVPVEGAQLFVRQMASRRVTVAGLPSLVDQGVAAQGATDAQGRFSLTLSTDDEFLLRAEVEGWAPVEYGPFRYSRADGLDVGVLEPTRGGTLVGQVIDGDQARQTYVVLVARGDGQVRTVRTDGGGAYRLDHLVPGPIFVRIVPKMLNARGAGSFSTWGRPYRAIEGDTIITAGKVTRYDLVTGEAKPRAVLRGRFRWKGPGPARLVASLVPLAETGVPSELEDPVLVGEDGQFTVLGGAPGRYALALRDASEVADGDVLRFAVFLDLGAGENQWEAAVAFGEVRAGEHADRGGETLFWSGPEGLMAMAPLPPSGEGRLFPAGIVSRVTQPSMAEAVSLGDLGLLDVLEVNELLAGSETVVGR